MHVGVPAGSEISSHRGSGLLYGIARASGSTGSCPASLEISTSRAICGGTYCQSALPIADGHWAAPMRKGSVQVQLTFSDSDHGALCIRDIDYACTT
jgi:hypothetical protein